MDRRRWILVVNLSALLAAAFWLRTSSLGAIPEVHADEAWHGVQCGRILRGEAFETRVYSGNPVSPFYSGMVLPFLVAFGPQPWVVRVPAAICGLLAVVLMYYLMKPVLDQTTATVAAMLLAVLPSAIVLSRVGFDCSQQPLASVVVLYFAFRGQKLGLVTAMAASLVVHPTSLFLLPMVVPIYLARSLPGSCRKSQACVLMGTLAMAGLAALVVAVPASHRPYAVAHAAMFYKPPDWGRFVAGFARFLLAISLPPHEPHLIHKWLVPTTPAAESQQVFLLGLPVFLIFITGSISLVRGRRWDRVALVLGWLVSAALLHMAGGATVMESTFRYAAVLVAPFALAVAVLVEPLLNAIPARRRWLGVAALVVVGWILLGCARKNWFAPRLYHSDEKLLTFAADVEDSHRRALVEACKSTRTLIAQDYWSYYPLVYYSLDHPGVEVVRLDPDAIRPDSPQPGLIDRLKAGDLAIGFHDGGLATAVASSGAGNRVERREIRLNDRDWLQIYRWK